MVLKYRLKFEPRDAWIGAYIDTHSLRAYVCFIPFVPLIIEPEPRDAVERYLLDTWHEGGDALLIATWREGGRLYIKGELEFTGGKPRVKDAIRAANMYLRQTTQTFLEKLDETPF